uniref:Xylanase inhibitor N-terminal domain-containing protein n=1 Tax=Nelumbo nucifera TaxID=4432 RepID=A0A822XMC8_NELNU|nr:TPA_asm: hypothetical protein HUJ06_021388 [Nelumbo nucifera]
MVGFSRNRIGLPSQLAAALNFNRKFAICLPSSTSSDRVVFFGNGPYTKVPGIDLSETLQLEKNLVQLDVDASRLGFSSSLLTLQNDVLRLQPPSDS